MHPMPCRRELKIRLTTTLLAMVSVAGVSVAIAALKPTPPKNVDLTALWKINPELSDDPQEVLAKKRDDDNGGASAPVPRGGGTTGAPGTAGRPGRPGSGTSTGGRRNGVDMGDIFGGVISGSVGTGRGRGGNSDRPDEDPVPQSSMRIPLDSFLATREQFEIEQRPEALTIRTVDETSTCKPADTGKVPMPDGEMVERRCGWQGSTFVVELKSDDGMTRVNRYELRKNNQQLVMISEVKGGRGHLAGLQLQTRLRSPRCVLTGRSGGCLTRLRRLGFPSTPPWSRTHARSITSRTFATRSRG